MILHGFQIRYIKVPLYRPVAVLIIVQRDLIVFIMNLIIARHHFGGQSQDRVYSPVCLIGHFGHNRVSFRALPTLLNNVLLIA